MSDIFQNVGQNSFRIIQQLNLILSKKSKQTLISHLIKKVIYGIGYPLSISWLRIKFEFKCSVINVNISYYITIDD